MRYYQFPQTQFILVFNPPSHLYHLLKLLKKRFYVRVCVCMCVCVCVCGGGGGVVCVIENVNLVTHVSTVLFLVLSLQMYRFCILAGLLAVAWAQVRTVQIFIVI